MSHFLLTAGNNGKLRPGFLLLILLTMIAGGSFVTFWPSSVFAASTHHTGRLAQTGQWKLSTAATNGPDNSFKGTAALSPNDVWAVGATSLFSSSPQPTTLIEHWNGTRWSIVKSPNATGVPSTNIINSNVLNAVTATSTNDVWAVGYTGINGFQGAASLVEHWNGRSWSIVTSPNGVLPSFSFYNILTGVSGTSANDVWAVGWNGIIDSLHRPTIQHWDGTKWSLTPVPAIGNNAQDITLEAVTALAPNNVWATGYYGDMVGALFTHALALHWDGTQWNVVTISDLSLSTTANRINVQALSAISANDIWATGDVLYFDAQGVTQAQALIEHWNGTSWTVVTSPTLNGEATTLTGIAAFASNDIWAVGTSGLSTHQPLLEHWDGTSWSIVAAPQVSNFSCGLFGVAATPGGATGVGACIALNSTAQLVAKPLVELFR